MGHPGINPLVSPPFQIRIRFSRQKQVSFFQVLRLPNTGPELTEPAASESHQLYFRGGAALATMELACLSFLPSTITWALLIKLSSHFIESQIIVILMNSNCFWVRLCRHWRSNLSAMLLIEFSCICWSG